MQNRYLTVLSTSVILLVLFITPASADSPEERVAAYHQALLDGNIDAARGMLAENLLLFEDGTVETSREHYAGDHMKADIAFSAEGKRKLERQSAWTEGDTATVSSTYDLKTRYKGKRYHIKAAETMTLKRVDGQWIIVHIHWSNNEVKN